MFLNPYLQMAGAGMVERVMSNVQLTFWAIFMRERNRRTVLQQVSTYNFVQQLFSQVKVR